MPLVSLPEAAKRLGVHRVTIYRLIKRHNLKTFQTGIGRTKFVELDEILALAEPKPSPKPAKPKL